MKRVVLEGLSVRKWNEGGVVQCKKVDLVKERMAQRLQKETLFTMRWIAKHLKMGKEAYLNYQLSFPW